jgi:hypothetical protein
LEQDDTIEKNPAPEEPRRHVISFWRTAVFVVFGMLEALCWLADGSFRFISQTDSAWGATRPFLVGFVWLYTAFRSIIHPTVVPPYDVFTIYCFQLVGAVLTLGGVLYDNAVAGIPLPSGLVMFGMSLNLTIIVLLLVVVCSMRMQIPNDRVNKADIVSPSQLSNHL